MKRRLFLATSFAATAAAATGTLAACGSSSAPAGAAGSGGATAKTTVRLGDTVPESNPEIAAERHFGARLAELSKNAYEVKVFPNSTLGDAARMNEQVRQGSLQMTKTLSANLSAFDKSLGILTLPYAFTKQEDLFTALDGELGTKYKAVVEKYGLKVLAFFDSGARNVYNTKRAIRTPADLKGLRLRVPQDSVAIDTFNTLGAQATPLAANEIYSALQQGVIDGAENNPIFYVTNKHVEEAKFWSWTRHQFGTDTLLVSKKWFDEQAKPLQDALVQAGAETQKFERDSWKAETSTYVDKAVTAGAKANDDVDVAAFRQAVKPVWTKHLPEFGDLGSLVPAL